VDVASELPPESVVVPPESLPPSPLNMNPPSGTQKLPPKPVILQLPEGQSEFAEQSWKPAQGAAAHDAVKPPPPMPPQQTWPPEQLAEPVQLMETDADPSGQVAAQVPVGMPPAPPPEKQHD
jgi:hypothetical protein